MKKKQRKKEIGIENFEWIVKKISTLYIILSDVLRRSYGTKSVKCFNSFILNLKLKVKEKERRNP